MSKTSRTSSSRSSSSKPPRRGGWIGVALGGVVCLSAVVYVTADGLREPSGLGDEAAAGGDAERSSSAASATPPAPTELASMAQMFGRDLPAEVQTMLEGSTPAHMEYDAANDRHWWAPHNHWHPGPPPDQNAPTSLPPGVTMADAPPFDMNAPAVMPDGSVPGPWDYDQVNNRHWHAGHGHWHQGPPPPEDQRE